MRIYLAGPLFTGAERYWNRWLAQELEILGHDVWLPQDKDVDNGSGPYAVYSKCRAGIEWADLVFVCLDGPDPDSGTAWEHGYAVGLGKKVIGYITDIRFEHLAGKMNDVNLMLTQSAPVLRLHYIQYTKGVAAALAKFLDDSEKYVGEVTTSGLTVTS